ncbi:MAG: DHA2 family efflux MFS transporter permease subunit, partial [Blastocatellia bacterium]
MTQEWKPAVNPWIIAASVMAATFMVVLDTSVANVALPHIAGSLSASTDESTWVLTSYLVSNAIVLPATGWISNYIGRRRFLIASIVIFTLASAFCGASASMGMLIVARVIQGAGGGGMQPIAQAVLLESFPPQKRGLSMAVYGMGVVVAPIIGPTLGGWITDNYSWRWVFYINLPVGIIAILMALSFIEDPPYIKQAAKTRVDYSGFGFMALWLATLQLVLDKGQEADWLSSSWIVWCIVISGIAMIAFVGRELFIRHPIVNLRVLKDRNFTIGTSLAGAYGAVLYATTALLPLFLQTLLDYPAVDSGLAVSPRGVGALISMMVVGRLIGLIDGRILIGVGFAVLGYATYLLGDINLSVSMSSVVWPNLLSGLAMG